ncbi:MAG: hypothetical protein CR988_07205 [Treponema sp.]|nr:MAG: hypothetical protein CR988_07205 [Treponema sp.]
MKKLFFRAFFVFFFTFAFFSITAEDADNSDKNQSLSDLPTSYRGISLGMDIESVKDVLQSDPLFGYRGERDLSLLPTLNRSSIETAGVSFVSRAWFQFHAETLYTMILKLNTDKIDYYSIYSHFEKKYGQPVKLNPQRAIWENETTRVIIERPLSVKYIDLTVFNELIEQSNTEKAASELRRESFVDEF